MAYMLSERIVSPPLTAARVDWLQYVLTQYGVSDAGARQFTQQQIVWAANDRLKLLDVLNRVVTDGSRSSDRVFRGKGDW